MQNQQLEHRHHQPSEKRFSLCLLAHDLESPQNVGSLFRLADALGLEKIYLSGSSPKPPNKKITRTSRSTEKYVEFEYIASALDVITRLRADDYLIIALEIAENSINLHDLDIQADAKICLMLGTENFGISAELMKQANIVVHIPMQGNNSSMNVSHACAIASYVLTQKLTG